MNQTKYFENLKLALKWNRDDIAENFIFTGEDDLKPEELSILMEMALIQNKPNFVKLLLDNGLDLKSFLTVKRLLFLYNSEKVISLIFEMKFYTIFKVHQISKKSPLLQLFKRKYLPKDDLRVITFDGVYKFLKDFSFENFKPNFLKNLRKNYNLDHMENFLVVSFYLKNNIYSFSEKSQQKRIK